MSKRTQFPVGQEACPERSRRACPLDIGVSLVLGMDSHCESFDVKTAGVLTYDTRPEIAITRRRVTVANPGFRIESGMTRHRRVRLEG